MPRVNTTDRQRLDALAAGMIGEARSTLSPRILSSNGFSNSYISILLEQVRCAYLAWALKYTGQIKTGDVIGIVGGSFSGLMLATALALCNNVIVYVFEKERRLMHRFLDKSHRFIAPNLNSRGLQNGFHPTTGSRFYDPPIFNWQADAASTVAANWCNEFNAHAATLPIFLLLGRAVRAAHILATAHSVTIRLDQPEGQIPPPPVRLDWLIDATGFGPESNPYGLVDSSYWDSGHRLIYDYVNPNSRVLVSGCGDSGIIELMHYAIKDFSHQRVDAFWPPARHLDLVIDQHLEAASFDDVTDWQDDWDLEELPLASELRWFRAVCRRAAEGYHGGPDDLDRARSRMFETLRRQVLLSPAFTGVRKRDWQALFDRLPMLSTTDQAAARKALAHVLDEESSIAICDVMQGIDVNKIIDMKALHAHRRISIEIVLNGLTPTPFTRQLSPFNVWLMYVMQTFPNVVYRPGKISVTQRESGDFDVRFASSAVERFDRVVTRYGPGVPERLVEPHADVETAGYLLVSPNATVMTRSGRRNIDLASHEIERARERATTSRLSRRGAEHKIEKGLYVSLLLAPKSLWPKSPPVGAQYTQRGLVRMIRDGVCPQFLHLDWR